MSAVERVLVVGGGLAGTSAAILLAQGGVAVEVAEARPDVSSVGSGITLQGNALRVLRQLGVWPRIEQHGFAFNTVGLRAPDAHGTLLVEMPDHRTGGSDLPATVGMYRPELARLLVDRAVDVGAVMRMGTTVDALTDDGHGVEVTFTGGGRGRYDLVIGADGLRSSTRRMIGLDLETRATGMGIWRAFVPRPAEVERTDLYYGGLSYIAGYCPTGADTLYAYIVEAAQDRSGLTSDEQLQTMRDLAASYHGPFDAIRDSLTDPTTINYTWFRTHLLDRPWNRGRVVLIGDAAHACPPTLAQGAAMGLEDATVLSELLLTSARIDNDLWGQFMDRRHARVAEVAAASVQLGQWLLDGNRDADVPGLMGRIARLVSNPA